MDRQTDPSLLFEQDSGFQLRIYPLTAEERRKVKITILLPTDWDSDFVNTTLPTNILGLSYEEVPSYRFLVKLNDEWSMPDLVGIDNQEFTAINDSEFGDVLELILDEDEYNSNKTIAYEAPFEASIYLNTHEGADDNFYQVVVNPAEFGIAPSPKKMVFCIDLNISNTTTEIATIWNQIKEVGNTLLTESDSFNVVYHSNSLVVDQLFDTWKAFNSDNFDELPLITGSTNVQASLLQSTNFINNNGEKGDIVLILDSNDLFNKDLANQVLNQVTSALPEELAVHVFNFRQGNGNGFQVYFNLEISNQTGGYYYYLNDSWGINGINQGLANIFNQMEIITGYEEIYTMLAEGICLHRYDLQDGYCTSSLHRPIKQVGQFIGNLPFEIDYTTIVYGEVNSQQLTINETAMATGDTLNEEMWAWSRIQEMESNVSGSAGIAEIVDFSMEHRVLSKYTAFLAVEPSILPDEECFGCWEYQDYTVFTEDIPVSDDLFEIQALPNPFVDKVLINLKMSADTDIQKMKFAIYEQLGRLVGQPTILQRLSAEKLQLTWDGRDGAGNDLPAGTYYLSVVSEKGKGNYKLLKI
ncbi:MAG: hypothetical protein ACI9XO_002558 [Paraglaciecola sp.]